MDIAFDISQVGHGKVGCGFFAQALIQALLSAENRYKYTLLPSCGDFFHDPNLNKNPPFQNLNVKFGPRLVHRHKAETFWQDPIKVNQYLQSFDLIHTNNFWCPKYSIDIPFIYTLYDMSFAEYPQWTTEANRLGCFRNVLNASLYADFIIAISKATKCAFLHHFPHVKPEKVRVIYPASRFQPSLRQSLNPAPPNKYKYLLGGHPFFLCVSTIEPRKNHEMLIRAYNKFRSRNQQAILLVLVGGPGWCMNNFIDWMRSTLWSSDIYMLGYVRDDELAWLYSNCIANLYPSYYEGFGLPVLECMEFGSPVIASNCQSISEIIANSGLLLPSQNEDAWVYSMERIVCEPTLRRELSEAALERCQAFSWHDTQQQVLNLYAEVSADA